MKIRLLVIAAAACLLLAAGCDKHKDYAEKTKPLLDEMRKLNFMADNASDYDLKSQKETMDAKFEQWTHDTSNSPYESRLPIVGAVGDLDQFVSSRLSNHENEGLQKKLREEFRHSTNADRQKADAEEDKATIEKNDREVQGYITKARAELSEARQLFEQGQ